jgi:hypothetical protein
MMSHYLIRKISYLLVRVCNEFRTYLEVLRPAQPMHCSSTIVVP